MNVMIYTHIKFFFSNMIMFIGSLHLSSQEKNIVTFVNVCKIATDETRLMCLNTIYGSCHPAYYWLYPREDAHSWSACLIKITFLLLVHSPIIV